MKETAFFSGKVIAAILLTYGVLSVWKPDLSGPAPTPEITPPSVSLQALVGPITEVLSGHKEQAKVLAGFYLESSKIIRRDGQNGKIIKTKYHLKLFLERAATIRFKGAFQKIHGLSESVHGSKGVLSKILGLESGVLDHAKAADALHAVAWACQEAE